MYSLIEKDIKDLVNADDESLQYVLSHFKLVKAKRNQFLLKEGEVCRTCYFINKGCVQVYYLDKNNDEATRDFFFEGQWMTNIDSFSKKEPSGEFFRAIESTELLAIDRDSFFQLISKVPQFMEAYRQILEASYSHSIQRINSFNAMDALERLHWVREYQSHILTRLPSKIIASYLGVSPETLSRLKSKLRAKRAKE
jgi:CRP-like cAMP-binding protein